MDTSSNEKRPDSTSPNREVPRPFVIAALVATVLVSVAVAWLQIRRGSRPTVDDLQARWVALADSVQDLRGRGRYAEALLTAAQSVALAEQAYGPAHPATAEALGELATLRIAAADLDGVDELLHRAADIQARVTGPDSPEVAGTLNSLAQLLEKRGEFDRARDIFDRTLGIYRKTCGDDHALTARTLNNIACLEDARGNHDAAERLHREAVGIREHLLGPAHLDTAESYGNLAANARSRGDLETAETFQRRALVIRERSAGMNHPLTAASLAGLANVLRESGRFDEADLLGLAALAIRQDTYGFRHPTTASSLETLASIRADQGDATAARALLEKSLVIRRGKAPGHPATAKTLEQVALLAPPADESSEQAATRRTRAIDLLEEAVAIRSSSLGAAHADTLTAMKHLAAACDRAGLPDRSRQVAKRMTDLIAADGGPDAPPSTPEATGKAVAETAGRKATVAE